jgi:hypothetical protein
VERRLAIARHTAVGGVLKQIDQMLAEARAKRSWGEITISIKDGKPVLTFDRTMDEDRAADERDIAKSGGAAIGGSIIGNAGKPLDSFERGGKIRTVPGGRQDRDRTGGDVDLGDDYGDESTS